MQPPNEVGRWPRCRTPFFAAPLARPFVVAGTTPSHMVIPAPSGVGVPENRRMATVRRHGLDDLVSTRRPGSLWGPEEKPTPAPDLLKGGVVPCFGESLVERGTGSPERVHVPRVNLRDFQVSLSASVLPSVGLPAFCSSTRVAVLTCQATPAPASSFGFGAPPCGPRQNSRRREPGHAWTRTEKRRATGEDHGLRPVALNAGTGDGTRGRDAPTHMRSDWLRVDSLSRPGTDSPGRVPRPRSPHRELDTKPRRRPMAHHPS